MMILKKSWNLKDDQNRTAKTTWNISTAKVSMGIESSAQNNETINSIILYLTVDLIYVLVFLPVHIQNV